MDPEEAKHDKWISLAEEIVLFLFLCVIIGGGVWVTISQ